MRYLFLVLTLLSTRAYSQDFLKAFMGTAHREAVSEMRQGLQNNVYERVWSCQRVDDKCLVNLDDHMKWVATLTFYDCQSGQVIADYVTNRDELQSIPKTACYRINEDRILAVGKQVDVILPPMILAKLICGRNKVVSYPSDSERFGSSSIQCEAGLSR